MIKTPWIRTLAAAAALLVVGCGSAQPPPELVDARWQRLAENPEMVIPFKPEESELWILIQRNEMPPPDSSQGPLTKEQKEVVRKWFAAGAPAGEKAAPKTGGTIK